ncbi:MULTISPECIES: acyltransferase family protein [Luteimonas]|uniref:acyltransferase family protein n=1 Tax=Luteimonas TaxID=83614 RepID=UPI0013047B76|nr:MULTISPECIES: acyltransferase family protein [Luteimonas]
MKSGVISYRPEIDGLRALAVLSVVLFHLDERLLPGGFVGVDIFFVISGFLITAILRREMLAGRFSFGTFYRRRILRIAPAYVAVTLATLVAGCALLLPADIAELAKSALWSALSLPNVYFWLFLDTSYFAPASNQIPLLHLWSLGVEEQFYMLWPALLLLLVRWTTPRITMAITILIVIGSFVLAQRMLPTDGAFSYYMLPSRAGELLLGALLALAPRAEVAASHPRGLRRAAASELLAVAGYALIAYSLFALDGESPFPGANAIYPCLGAALLILAGGMGASVTMAPLRWKPVVWIGLISYSLYLWHWPILAFTRYFLTSIDFQTGMICLLAMLVVSTLSYRFIELPFRDGRHLLSGSRPFVFAGYAATVVGLGVVAGVLIRTDGLEAQVAAVTPGYEAAQSSIDERTRAALSFGYNCQRAKMDRALFRSDRCVVGPAGAPVRGVLVGDSNAAHYVGVLGALSEPTAFGIRNVTLSSCPPLFGAKDRYGKSTDVRGCTLYRNRLRRETARYEYVFLGAQWTSHAKREGFERDLRRTLHELTRQGKKVVILGQVPRFPSYDRSCELRRVRLPMVDCSTRSAVGGRVDSKVNAILQAAARRSPGVEYMDVSDLLCPSRQQCSPYLDGQPIYYDPGHLSMTGSWEVGRAMLTHGMVPRPILRTFQSPAVEGRVAR